MSLRLPHFIDGAHRPPASGRWLEVTAPATGEVHAECAAGDATDIAEAVAAAQRAFPAWSGLPNSVRAGWLHRLADALEARLEDFAAAESLDAGKPIRLTREVEIPRAVSNLRFFAAAASQFSSESHHGEAGLNYTLRRPLGAVACISPWNLPLYLLTWKIAPALAAGCTVVAKPSEVTPLTAHLLGELCAGIGLPPGVLNLVHGLGAEAGEALVTDPGIAAVSFTGSTAVGRRIAAHCAAALKKASLELGGKNPVIVFADAPREGLVDLLARAAFQNSGQICLCGSRILIERSVYADIRDALVARAHALVVGDPADPTTDLGPLVSRAHFDKVSACLTRARDEGGRMLCGGARVEHPALPSGWAIAPTLIEGLGPDCATNTEEIFGPVATLQPFQDEAEALTLANATPYGLAASIFTSDLGRAHRMAARVRAGIVWVNTWMLRDLRTPFGGMGQSGLGREGGMEAMRFFTEPRNVCVAVPPPSHPL